MDALLSTDDIARLREALGSADYTSTGLAARIGPDAAAALGRNDLRGLLRATAAGAGGQATGRAATGRAATGRAATGGAATGGAATGGGRDRLGTLARLFLAGQTEPVDAVARALAPLSLESAVASGLVEPYGDGLHAGLDLDVYTGHTGQQWWVVSDLDLDTRPRPARADHVLGIGNAATTLAGATTRRQVGTALDLGTGCGVQALELHTQAAAVTATDISDRALRFAATTAALNGMEWELLAGDLTAPVAGRRFDLVVSNPPFVVGPGTTRFTYRDSGREGDSMCASLAGQAGELLTEGGTMQFLANWLYLRETDWHDRVASWIEGTGCDAWVIQREISDPIDYVNLWMRDTNEPFDPARAQVWLDWFDAHDIEAVGFGIVTLRRTGSADPFVRIEDLRQPIDGPLGPQIDAWFDRRDWLSGVSVLDQRLRRAPGLQLTQEATFADSDDDWQVGRQVLSLPAGLRWSEEVDPVALALVSGADGGVTVRDQLAVLASAFDTPEPVLAAMAAPIVDHLVERGILLPS